MTAILKPSSRALPAASRAIVAPSTPAARSRRDRQQTTSQYSAPYSSPALSSRRAGASAPVQALPVARSLPPHIKVIVMAQRTSTVVTFGLIASVLAVYSWTVYSQQLWGKEYRRLESLQRNERQLTSANESLKSQIAQQAESPEAGLVLPSSANRLFLEPAPQRYQSAPPATQPAASSNPSKPFGY